MTSKIIVMVIAYRNFQDIEYFIPRDIFLHAGFQVITTSSRAGIAISDNGNPVKIYKGLREIDINQSNALIFCGGRGAPKYLDNDISYKVLREAEKEHKLIGAICISPIILAKSGILSNKRATVWTSPLEKSATKVFKSSKVQYIDKPVVIDDNIITASGARSSSQFAHAIIKMLTKNK